MKTGQGGDQAMMPVGPILLLLLGVLVYGGFFTTTLGRVGLSTRRALWLMGLMLLTAPVELGLLPGLSINLGLGVIPLALGLYMLLATGSRWEWVAALAAALVAGAAISLLGRWMPAGRPTELNLFFLDAAYFYALVAGAAGYMVGQSRAAAYLGAVAGAMLGDLYHYAGYVRSGEISDLVIRIAGGGFHGTALTAGILAVTLAELLTAAPVQKGEDLGDHLPQP